MHAYAGQSRYAVIGASRHFIFLVRTTTALKLCLHVHFSQVIEDDVNEALRLMKMSKVRLRSRPCDNFHSRKALAMNTLLLSQVSLEDTMQDDNPKLDPITAVYMVRRCFFCLLDTKQTVKVIHFSENRPSVTGLTSNTPRKFLTTEQLRCL